MNREQAAGQAGVERWAGRAARTEHANKGPPGTPAPGIGPPHRLCRQPDRLGILLVLTAAICALCSSCAYAVTPIHNPLPELSHGPEPFPAHFYCGAATDSEGDLYLSDKETKEVTVYDTEGEAILSFSTASFLTGGGPCQMAVDSSGDVYLANQNRKEAVKLNPSSFPPQAGTTYELDTSLNGNGVLIANSLNAPTSVAVDPATDDVYASAGSGNEVQEFDKPTESYKLRVEDPETEVPAETAELLSTATNAEIQTALRNALCGGANCATVAASGERWKITFNGTATTPVTAKTDIAPSEVIKGGCTPGSDCDLAWQLFNGSPVFHIASFQADGTPVSNTIGDFISGAAFYGSDVYGKNGNVYVTDKANGKAYVLNPSGDAILAEFDGSGSPAGAFDFSPSGSLPDLAIDQSNGHAYVSDMASHHVVDEFDGAGSFVSELTHSPELEEGLGNGLAVDNSASSPNRGTIYFTALLNGFAEGALLAYGPLSAPIHLPLPELSHGPEPFPAHFYCGAATDSEGDLYLSDKETKEVTVYDTEGEAILSFSTASFLTGGGPCQMAVDSSGDVYLANQNRKEAVKLNPSSFPPQAGTTYELDTSLNGNGVLIANSLNAPTSVAVDPATDDVYASAGSGNEVQEFDKPTESYKLRVEDPETESPAETAELLSTATNAEIQTALRNALCGGANCATVAASGERWKITFNGTATTPVTAKTDIAPSEVIKGGCTPGSDCDLAWQLFNGSPVFHIASFQADGTPVSNTIGDFISGAAFYGSDVYGKNGNVYVTDKANNKAYVLNPSGDAILAEFDGSGSPKRAPLTSAPRAPCPTWRSTSQTATPTSPTWPPTTSSMSSTAPAPSSRSSPTAPNSKKASATASRSTTPPRAPTGARSTSPPCSTASPKGRSLPTGRSPTPSR